VKTPIILSAKIYFNSVFLTFFDLFGEISFDKSPIIIEGRKLLMIFALEFK
jgi:hypothetical protein